MLEESLQKLYTEWHNQSFENGLYVVATPIGNVADITVRAFAILKHCDVLLCEDTRKTANLLARLGISGKKTLIYNEHKSGYKSNDIDKIVELCRASKVALVSDAGTPSVCDPASVLVSAVQMAGVKIFGVPGASSLATALSVCGVDSAFFTFLGFFDKSTVKNIQALSKSCELFVFFESPHSIAKTLQEVSHKLNNPEIVVCKELTKLHEKVVAGRVLDILANHQNLLQQGEFVVVVKYVLQSEMQGEDIGVFLRELMNGRPYLLGLPTKLLVAVLQDYHAEVIQNYKVSGAKLYDLCVEIKTSSMLK